MIPPGEVVVEDGRLSSTGRPSNGSHELVDLEDRWVLLGYIDVHAHGGAGAQCSTADPGMPDGECRLGGRTISEADRSPRGADDAIAGSTVTMEATVQNAIHLLGAPIEELAVMASAN